MNVEFRHLRYFVAVVEEGTFTAAARRVHVAQQVLSAQVRQLEDAVGVELLQRSSRGVTLTPAGSAFLDGARETLRVLDRTTAAAQNIANTVAGRLTVGLSVAAGGDIPTNFLADFRSRCPEIDIELRTYELNEPAAGLLDHTTDVAFVRPPVNTPLVTTREIASEPRVFVLPAGHPLVGLGPIDMSQVAGLPWIAADVASDGCDPNAWRDDWLVNPRPGGDQPIIGAVARTIDEWREHVIAGRGISLCPASAETHYSRPGIAFVKSRDVPVASLCLAWLPAEGNAVVQRFVEFVTEAAHGIS